MTKRRKLIVGATILCIGVSLILGPRVYFSYQLARNAADHCMNQSIEGSWMRWKTGFTIDFNPDHSGRFLTPHWVFRYRHARSGDMSKRVFVTVTGDRVFSYEDLDPMPIIGLRP